MFYPGQHVVCVRDDWTNLPRGGEKHPVRGGVYTVRKVVHDGEGKDFLLLSELRNPLLYDIEPFEACFTVRKFRPLSETRLDIFRKHLAPAPKKREVA